MPADDFSATIAFPSPTNPASSRRTVFLRYLEYFRSRLGTKLIELPVSELRRSRLPSGWSPLELAKPLPHGEMRWLAWGVHAPDLAEPCRDSRGGAWAR